LSLSVFVAWPDDGSDQGRATRALIRALERELASLPDLFGRCLTSMLVAGAGPPSAASIEALLAALAQRLAIGPEIEATLAIEPRTATARRLADYRAAGITRLAMRSGVLDQAAEAALRTAATLFPRIAVDLAFLRPGQGLPAWQAELDRVLRLGVGHVSIEEWGEGTADSDLAAAFYELALERLSAGGLPAYEIGHFARPGEEARQLLHGATGGDYLGIGPGAVGRMMVDRACHASAQIESPMAWLRMVEAGREAAERRVLTAEQRLSELLLTGLRLRAGIERAWFEPLVGAPLETVLPARQLASLIEDGFVCLDQIGLRLTRRGWLLCDAVVARLLG
jgi:coproporphyrinogen III oxidase-like Fe-S oxidoreductase